MAHQIRKPAIVELDVARYELRLDGRRVKLEPLPMDLLIALIDAQGCLVTREEIIGRLWGKDVFVDTVHAINGAIRKIRHALRDDADHPAYIETVVGKGYRFIGPFALAGSEKLAADGSGPVHGQRPLPPTPMAEPQHSKDPEAQREFMSGLRESYSNYPQTLQSAVEHLSRAIELDPGFALAHAWLAYVSMNVYFSFDPRPARLEAAEEHCGRALLLDPALPEGHLARAFILWSPARNFQHAEAIAALEQVLAVQPNSEQAHNRMSTICLHIGRLHEARIAYEQVPRSNPKNPEFFYLWGGDFAAAEKAGEAWIREKPNAALALWFHPQPPLMTGDLDLAERRLAAAEQQLADEPLIVSLRGILHARRNQTDSALECVRNALDAPRSNGHTHHTYYQIACVYAVLRKTDKAMAWLERSVDTGFPCWPFFKLDPHLENLRQEPEFQRLVADLEQKYTALEIRRL